MTATRVELRNTIDFLPNSILAPSGQAFLDFLLQEGQVLFGLLTALEDDEPETEEARAVLDEMLEGIGGVSSK